MKRSPLLKFLGRVLFIALWLCIFAFLTLLIFIPFGTSFLFQFGYEPNPEVTDLLIVLNEMRLPAMQLFVPLWVFVVGGCIASFLNVVAWRVPRGKSIIGPSQCPDCGIQLKFPKSNFPILGWLRNGGACVNCENPIPVRYLIAEVVLGTAFLLLFLLQTTSGGATIPFRDFFEPEDYSRNFFWVSSKLPIILVYHWILISLIFTLAIAATERFVAPRPVVLFGILGLIGYQYIAIEPGILDFQFGDWEHGVETGVYFDALATPEKFLIAVGLGAITASLCFVLIRFVTADLLLGSFASLILVGLALGWQSVLSVAAFSLLIAIITRIQFTSAIFLGTLVHLLTWRIQSSCQCWPGPASDHVQLALGISWVVGLATVLRLTKSTMKKHADADLDQQDLPDTGTGIE